MLNTNSNTERATAARRNNHKKGPIRSYLKLNVATFALVGLLLAFLTFQVGLETPQNTADTSNGANALVVPPTPDPFAASNAGTDTTNGNSAANNSDGSNGSFSSNGNGTYQNPFDNSNSNGNGGVQVNPPSYSQPQPFTKHS